MPWYVEVKTPDDAVAVYELDIGKVVTVGRDEGQIRIAQDSGVSSVHVQLNIKEREILWDDLHSTNGTYHRKLRKTSGVLLAGDQLHIGSTILRFDPNASKLIRR